jgi:hypothetical protein
VAGYETWREFQAACDTNHKVRYVIPVEMEDPVPVFDLEVDEWHNFALAGGVFVHNSKDEADALACAVFGAVTCGGEEESPDARAHLVEAEFAVGSMFELPIGTNLRRVWESGVPSV